MKDNKNREVFPHFPVNVEFAQMSINLMLNYSNL
jgi:hypothetical protein